MKVVGALSAAIFGALVFFAIAVCISAPQRGQPVTPAVPSPLSCNESGSLCRLAETPMPEPRPQVTFYSGAGPVYSLEFVHCRQKAATRIDCIVRNTGKATIRWSHMTPHAFGSGRQLSRPLLVSDDLVAGSEMEISLLVPQGTDSVDIIYSP